MWRHEIAPLTSKSLEWELLFSTTDIAFLCFSRNLYSAAILVTCGCCCIPFIRGLLQRLIDTTFTKTMYTAASLCSYDYVENYNTDI
ncbi:hypothetical protein XELAEV_18042182mg [Xenopus laevis]|uniref:Uncharacterized protein n=1 Tax=Xenopus laevis TaxID=8355 RepID=A0A974H5T3_XENLA|nr:hypothetical protein XELAEV_18042182mg [Xenopus laevis]